MKYPPRFEYGHRIDVAGEWTAGTETPGGQSFDWHQPKPKGFVAGELTDSLNAEHEAIWNRHGYRDHNEFFGSLHNDIPEDVWPTLERILARVSADVIALASAKTAVFGGNRFLGYF